MYYVKFTQIRKEYFRADVYQNGKLFAAHEGTPKALANGLLNRYRKIRVGKKVYQLPSLPFLMEELS